MLDGLAPARRRFVLGGLWIVAVLLLGLGGWALARGLDDPTPVSQDELGPVLMVPGTAGRPTTCSRWRKPSRPRVAT